MVPPGPSMASLQRPGGIASLRRLFQQTTPGFNVLQDFFSKWLNVDVTTLALALTVFGALSTASQHLRGVASQVYTWIVRLFTASVSIPGSDRLNREVLNWIGAKVLLRRHTRILTAHSEPVQNDAWEYQRTSINKIMHRGEKRLPVRYLPTFNFTWFFHEGRLFVVRRVAEGRMPPRMAYMSTDSADQYVVPPAGQEPLVVMCLGRSAEPIKKFLNMCRDLAEEQREAFVTVRSSRSHYHRNCWDTTVLRPIRPLGTVHMDRTVREELVLDIENYLKPATRRFYATRGIPYRRGYLLHGPPGTGKTSLSLALAGHFGLDLYIIHVPALREDVELDNLFNSLPPQCIVLLEDIDAAGMKRNHKPTDEETEARETRTSRRAGLGRVTISGLLNVLDGISSQEGRIVVMTTNIADKLDEALIRPGRIDKMIFLGKIDGQAAQEMFLRMFAPDPNDEPNTAETCTNISSEKLQSLASEFKSQFSDDVLTPAQLQGFLLDHRNDPETAISMIQSWTDGERMRMEKLVKGKPEAEKPEAEKPEVEQPEVEKPEAEKPEAEKPEA